MQKLLGKPNFIHKEEIGFVYHLEHVGVDGKVISRERIENIIPVVGRDYFLNAGLNGGAAYSIWYLGLYTLGYAPVAGETLNSLVVTTGVEDVAYTTTANARLLMVPDALSSGLWSNAGSPLEFDFAAGGTINGGFVTNDQFRGGTAHVLLSAVRFASEYVLAAGETLRVTAGIQLTAT